MDTSELKIIKASGEKALFSEEKVAASLGRAGASQEVIDKILSRLRQELYQGISTKEIYNRAFRLLKNKDHLLASRYKLKNAIYELGPTGFPFEKFVGAVLKYSGYDVEVGDIFQGACVTHEVDVIATREKETFLMECKFHSMPGKSCDVKVPLYIHSRFRDIENFNKDKKNNPFFFSEGWVVTNTKFTKDATRYAKCVDLKLLSWDYPKGSSLKDRIDKTGLYPITVSVLLNKREKQFLLSRDVVLCRELVNDDFYLDHLGISSTRKKHILEEMRSLCKA
ncbi:ATP cone domain-containing protein [Salegentibacter sediminis]|uniref:ATP cone domain-containing protein n=1 Tax=Salegentibacter sediminis TaxID=1930251 RepID=UPI0009BD2AD9|nr:ATP cone domain-containing protein [Salegentibacter sediminis]